MPLPIKTQRLTLIPSTAELASAAITDRQRFSKILNARITDQWPPETLADVEGRFAEHLTANPELAGWWGWYVISNDQAITPGDTLVGSIGCMPPDDDGMTMMGYSVLPAFEHRGIATEAAIAMTGWILSQPVIRTLLAETFEEHHASRKILTRCGFHLLGISPNDAAAAESDRQGRGRLIRYERKPA